MLQFVLDTDHVTLYEYGHPPLGAHLTAHGIAVVGVTIVTAEEVLRGRVAAVAAARDGAKRILRYGQLLKSMLVIQEFEVLPFDQNVENEYQRLCAMKLRIGARDLKIAAIALANQLKLVTRNARDFGQVPGLTIEDWSV